jgi:hypothetical protein
MAGDTDDGGKSDETRPIFSGNRLTVGFADGEASGCGAGAEFVVTVAGTLAWAAHRQGSTGASSNAVAAMEGQTVPFFMTNLTPFTGSPCHPGHEILPPKQLLYAGSEKTPRHPDRLEIATEIISPGFRGDDLVDRRVWQSKLDSYTPLIARAMGNNRVERAGEGSRIVRHSQKNR